MRILLLSIFIILSGQSVAQELSRVQKIAGSIFFSHEGNDLELHPFIRDAENPRLIAIALDVSLGILGMHRLYLGTDLKVPVLYTLTLGGGGVLWIVDLVLLIAKKDITSFMNNPHVFMWIPAE